MYSADIYILDMHNHDTCTMHNVHESYARVKAS